MYVVNVASDQNENRLQRQESPDVTANALHEKYVTPNQKLKSNAHTRRRQKTEKGSYLKP
jgi:hypothetical protein